MSRPFLLCAFLALSVSACGSKAPVRTAASSPFAAAPHLPNPRAGSYARVIQSPTDPAVAAMLVDHQWDASLAGTAAGLALKSLDNNGGFSRRELREAAWQAGYPYPISHLAVWQAAAKAPPPADVQVWLSELSMEMDVGLVRARSGSKDLWVGLAAHPLIDLGVIPRETALQTPIKLAAISSATLEVSGPLGQHWDRDLSQGTTVHLDSEGEWLFAIVDATGDLARFTIYAGVDAPVTAIIEGPAQPVSNHKAVKISALDMLADARDSYGLLPWSEDPYLTSTAASLLENPSAPDEEESTKAWQCRGRTVEDCVDQMIWIPAYRTALLNPDTQYVGAAGHLSEEGVELRIVITTQ
jgi:hypothetical protein